MYGCIKGEGREDGPWSTDADGWATYPYIC